MMRAVLIGALAGLIALCVSRGLMPASRAPQGLYQARVQTPSALVENLGQTGPDLQAKWRLEQKIKDLEIKLTGLGPALDELGKASGITFDVEWKSMQTRMVLQNLPFNIRIQNATVREGLLKILELATDAGVDRIGYQVQGGIVRVAPFKSLDEIIVTRVYNIESVIERAVEAKRRIEKPARGVMVEPSSDPPDLPAGEELIRSMEYLVLAGHIRADERCSMTYFAGLLIVSDTLYTHEKIAAYLERLRQKGPRP